MTYRYEPCDECNKCPEFSEAQESESTQFAINQYCEVCINSKLVLEDDEK